MRALLPIALGCIAPLANAQTVTLVRATEAFGGGDPNNGSNGCSMTPDGRFVVFTSSASNLIASDTNGFDDVFVYDVATAVVERASVSSSGTEGSSSSNSPSISADGRFVVFTSFAPDLVAADANNAVDVYLRDRLLGTTERISEAAGGGDADSFSFAAQVSGDGRFVAFTSFATNLVANDTNGHRDVFVHDRQLGTTERISESAQGVEGDAPSGGNAFQPAISFDGRYVAFASVASNFVPNDTNSFADLFVRDRALGTIERVTGLGGAEPDGDSASASMSADGRFVVFLSDASNLVAGDTNATFDVFVWQRETGVVERASVATSGAEGSLSSWFPSISADGRFVTFTTASSELDPNDSNGLADAYVRDRLSQTTYRESLDTGAGEFTTASTFPTITRIGTRSAFASPLVNGLSDVWVRTRHEEAYRLCEGTASACPCGNAGAPGAGCANSYGTSGELETSGFAKISNDTLTLVVSGLPPNTYVRVIESLLPSSAPVPFGDGLRCLGTGQQVLATRATEDGAAAVGYAVPGDPLLSVVGALPAGGDYRFYQGWYRNAATFCAPQRHNMTNAIAVLWRP